MHGTSHCRPPVRSLGVGGECLLPGVRVAAPGVPRLRADRARAPGPAPRPARVHTDGRQPHGLQGDHCLLATMSTPGFIHKISNHPTIEVIFMKNSKVIFFSWIFSIYK